MAGKGRQTSVETPAMMSFLRPAASTALANRGSSNALTVVRLMIEILGKASLSSGMIGPHISGEVAVTIIGTPKNLDRFRQRDDVMLQLRYWNVSDAREEPDLMVDEEQSGIVRREPFLVFFRFHSLLGSLRRSNWNDHAPTL